MTNIRALSTFRALQICLLVVATSLSHSGCSDAGGRQTVTGSVLWNGAPLEGGWIYFRPLEKGPSSAAEIINGEFKTPPAKGLLPGTYQVAIEYRKPTGKQVKVYTGEMIEEEQQIIPPQYNVQTTLQYEVQTNAPNHATFELEEGR